MINKVIKEHFGLIAYDKNTLNDISSKLTPLFAIKEIGTPSMFDVLETSLGAMAYVMPSNSHKHLYNLQEIRLRAPDKPLYIFASDISIPLLHQALRLGIKDVFVLPCDMNDLTRLQQEIKISTNISCTNYPSNSGQRILSLLADLGIRANANLSERELNYPDITDRYLTLTLYEIISLSNGHQLKQVTNAYDSFQQALQEHTLTDFIDTSMPQFNSVVRLRQAINQYKRLQNIEWPQIDNEFSPRLGQGHPEIRKLRRQLILLGDLNESAVSVSRAHIFDTEVVDAMKHFQNRHGLRQTGILDEMTRSALNMQVSERITILQANLWRWLSLPRIPPSKYILVNIPSFELSVVEHGNRVLDMKVIVGKESNPTPTMVTEVGWLTVNPTWTPTPNIVKNELIPLHRRNPNALKNRNFSLAQGYGKKVKYRDITTEDADLGKLLNRFRLVQKPGLNNALGKLRFHIKNNQYIFLHDTPAKSLFNKQHRALSHGCIRLERADHLLDHLLLSEAAATRHLAKQSSKSKVTQNLSLSSAVAIYVTYQTAWVDANGNVNWRNDLYELDNSHFNTTVSNWMPANI